MDWKNIYKLKVFYLALLLALNFLSICHLITGLFGFLVLAVTFWEIKRFISSKLKKEHLGITRIVAFFYVIAYYIFSLSLLYYTFGLSKRSFAFWVVFSIAPVFYDSIINKRMLGKVYFFSFFKKVKNYFDSLLKSPSSLIALILLVFLFSYLFFNQISNGSPTPWVNVALFAFIIFFVICYCLLQNILNSKTDWLVSLLFFFILASLISLKYQQSFGYDSMLHQAALDHIFKYGQIKPLTPFYIGQYVLEVVLKMFTGWSFFVIERWFMAVAFVATFFAAGKYFVRQYLPSLPLEIIPISVLFLIPSRFIYSSPYAFSLLWAVVSVLALFSYLKNNKKSDYIFSVVSVATSLVIHPFVGLNILPWILATPAIVKSKIKAKVFLIAMVTVISSLLVVLCFGVYNWLNGSSVRFNNPVNYLNNFFLLFEDPTWYLKAQTTFSLWLVYFYEKVSFALIILIFIFHSFFNKQKVTENVFYFFTFILWLIFLYSEAQFLFLIFSVIIYVYYNRKQSQPGVIILLLSLSTLVSAYLFFSAITVAGYSINDQINYTSRLLQTAKWLLWPLLLLVMGEMFIVVRQKDKIFKYMFLIVMSGVLTANWYLTYPRNDSISRMNINNIRAVDYKAIDYIYDREGGKDGYLVLSNQLFAAGAIQKYGFEPYYDTQYGKIFYYAIPMDSEMNRTFERIMTLENFDPSIIEKIYKATGLKKIYFIASDYWPLSLNSERQMKNYAKLYKNIDNKVNIYFFSNEQ